jgi:hypothetical protein
VLDFFLALPHVAHFRWLCLFVFSLPGKWVRDK